MTNLTLAEITETLTNLHIFKGIQPSELADSIFEESYVSMISEKKLDRIEVTLTFSEKCEISNKSYMHHMKYSYDKKCFLMKIEEAVNSKKFKTVWNRLTLIKSSLDALNLALKQSNYNEFEIHKIINTIPNHFALGERLPLKLVS